MAYAALTTEVRRELDNVTSIEDVISALATYDCEDLTPLIDSAACSKRPIAGGGLCDVYQGKLHSGITIAIKSLRMYNQLESEMEVILKRTARELYHWSKLKHCNVLPLLGLAIHNDCLSMISEWMENGSLSIYISRNPDANRVRLCVEVCTGLSYIHEKNMVHGDLKAANVLVSPSGTALIADFGSSRLKNASLHFAQSKDSAGFTLRWAAPELLTTDPQLTKETDVYAFGMTMLETLTGDVPYKELTDPQVLFTVGVERRCPRRPDAITNEQWTILELCWMRDSLERPAILDIQKRLYELLPHGPRAGLGETEEPSGVKFKVNDATPAPRLGQCMPVPSSGVVSAQPLAHPPMGIPHAEREVRTRGASGGRFAGVCRCVGLRPHLPT